MDMTETISLLYELSLAVGTTIELEQNSAHFLSVLMRRLNIDYASLWLRDNIYDTESSLKNYELTYAYPEFRVKKKTLNSENPIFTQLGKKVFKVLDESALSLKEYLEFDDESDHFILLYKLEGYGYLMFLSNTSWTKDFNIRFRQIKDVMQKFTRSIEAGIAYQNSLIEAQKNERLALLAQEKEQAILSMATPVAQLWENILLLPLVGIIDSQRAQMILEVVLSKVTETQSKILILDISGTAAINEIAINSLLKIVRSTQLMGCKCLLSGVSPIVAETIVMLNLDLGAIVTVGSMKDALNQAFYLTGQKLEKLNTPTKN